MFLVYIVLALNPKVRTALLGSDHEALAELGDSVSVSVDLTAMALTHLAEYERRLTVCNGWFSCSSLWLVGDAGGSRRVLLYLRDDGKYVAVDFAWMMEIDTHAPAIDIYHYKDEERARLRHERWDCRTEPPGPLAFQGQLPDSLYFRDLKYIGMFEFANEEGVIIPTVRLAEFRFVPSTQHGEALCVYPSRG